MKNTRLSKHFTLAEFLNQGKYPDNVPTMQAPSPPAASSASGTTSNSNPRDSPRIPGIVFTEKRSARRDASLAKKSLLC